MPAQRLDFLGQPLAFFAVGALLRCAKLADGFRHGRALSHGITVALVGPVNVGKSSLLNALVGKERAIVATQPGTTRDYLEVADIWNGVAVTIIDTAGTRATTDAIEARGIELGEQRVESADVVVVVNDDASPWDDGARYGARALVVRSKADLGGENPTNFAYKISTVHKFILQDYTMNRFTLTMIYQGVDGGEICPV